MEDGVLDLLEEYNDARKRFLTALKRYQEFDAVGLRSPSLDYGGRTHKKHDLSDPVVKKMELLEDYARKGRRYLELYEELREKICSSGLETDEEIVLLRRLLMGQTMYNEIPQAMECTPKNCYRLYNRAMQKCFPEE